MSVWKRFQRVGKKAGKFQFTASYTELIIETNNFKPSNVVITWLRRNRKYPSESIKLVEVKPKSSSYSHVWDVPKNEEITTTLYKMKKDLEYEEKDWTFQLEDVGDHGTRRRVLAYRNINISQYADMLPTQNSIKVSFKISSKKIQSATLFLTLSGVFLKEGDATDDDMISVASLMSLPLSQNYSSMHDSDIARLSDFDDSIAENSDNINEKFSELFDKIGSLDCQTWNLDNTESAEMSSLSLRSGSMTPRKESSPDRTSVTPIVRSRSSILDNENDRLSNIDEEDRSPCPESNSTSDLLDWCRFITRGYKNISITNFTTSFRNGMAFCAIIHHYNADLIDFESLTPSNVKENNRTAFTAAAKLGIPKVLDPNEMNFLKVPDSLSIMTYLHQLRTHFTDCNLVITPASICNNSQHSYSKQVTSNFSTTPVETKEFDSIVTVNLTPEASESMVYPGAPPCPVGDGRESACGEDLTDHTHTNVVISEGNGEVKPLETPDKSDVLLSTKKKSPKKSKMKLSSLNVDGSVKEDSSWSEKKIKRVNLGKLHLFSEHDPNKNHPLSPSKRPNNAVSPTSAKKDLDTINRCEQSENSYIWAETAALEGEQDKIDEEASQLERQLRLVLNKDSRQEEILLPKWFALVNKKNALIRRNMQLQILVKEQDLKKKCTLLQEELRQIISIEDWNKTEEMRSREELLMQDLVFIVNQRDKVVRDLDQYERNIVPDLDWAKVHAEMAPDSKFSRGLAHANFPDKNCLIQ